MLFSGLDLGIHRGTWTTILGRSGSGKTALLELVGLLRRPDSGEVRFGGRPVDWSDPAGVARERGRSVGFVFQLPVLDESATVRDNVLDGARLARLHVGPEVIDHLDHLARQVGVHQLLDRRVDALSGGEKQRISVLRALVKRPLLIVADEPTASLDTGAGEQVLSMLRGAMSDDGAAVVVVTHERGLAARSSSCLHLADGVLSRLPTVP